MKKILFFFISLSILSCSKDEESCRCQAATDGFLSDGTPADVFIERKCDDVSAADLIDVLEYAGTELGATEVYIDTATDIYQ